MNPLLSEDAGHSILKKVLGFSKADQCQVSLDGTESGNIRYARNSVSTSGSISQTTLVISSAYGKRLGVVTTNEYDDASLEKAVRLSEDLARLAPENPEFMPFLAVQNYGLPAVSFDGETSNLGPKDLTDWVSQSLQEARSDNLSAAGFLQNTASFSSILNSNGLFAYRTSTDINFSITLRTPDEKGSGYASRDFNRAKDLDPLTLTKTAAKKARLSTGARAIEPGKYTVILEPSAGIVLLEQLYGGLDARSADEGRSFLSAPGGSTKLGQKLVDERIHIYSNPADPRLPTSVWAGDGRPQEKVSWIEGGILKNLSYSRFWANKKGVKAVPSPDGIIMEGTEMTLEDLIKGTEKGILVTRLWYIRPVDPQTLLFTGLTRDGTFYIEKGMLKFPIKNLRFNESPIIMLNNLDALGKSERVVSGESFQSAMIPPMRIRDFTFSSLSDAI